MMNLGRFRVGTRVTSGFAALLLMLLGACSFGYFLLVQADQSFVAYRTLARDSNLTAETEIDVIKARLSLKEFLLTGRDETKATIQHFFAETAALIAKAERQITDPDRLHLVERMKAGLLAYERGFARVAQLSAEVRRLKTEVLDVNGPAMEKELSAIMRTAKRDGDSDAAVNAGEALRALLLARLYANRYEIDHAAASVERVRTELAGMEGQLAALDRELQNPERRRLAAEARQQFGLYRTGFEAKVRNTAEMLAVIERELDANGRTVTDIADKVRKDIQASQDELGPRVIAEARRGEQTLLAVAVLSLLVAGGLAWVVGRSIVQPIATITAVMRALATGDTGVQVPDAIAGARDEVAEMGRAVAVFRQNAIAAAALAGEQAALQQKVEREKRAATTALADRFEADVAGVARAVAEAATQLQDHARVVSDVAQGTNRQSVTVAAASQETSENVQTVAAAAEELSASVAEIGGQVTMAAAAAGQASSEAQGAGTRVTELAGSVSRIGQVVELINQIAAQTNLLALNATIEAARAGEAGRGFAVVAAEVKSLATQTAKATEEIAGQIGAVQGATGEVVRAIEAVSGRIAQVNEISTAIAAAVQEQGAAVAEIARNVSQAAQGTGAVTHSIADVSQAAQRTGEVSSEMVAGAAHLTGQATVLTRQIAEFMQGVRAA